MQIVTASGKTYDAAWILDTATRHGVQQLTMQLPGTTDPGDIVRDLVGLDVIKGTKENGDYNTYVGYRLLSSLIYTADRSAIRLTLEKGETA